MQTLTDESHSLNQAKSKLEGIKEMIRACSIETAAEDFSKTLSESACIRFLEENREDLSEMGDLEQLREKVASWLAAGCEMTGFSFNEDDARQAILEHPLEIQVRSDWESPGTELRPTEYFVLLCTGGPEVRIIGGLNDRLEATDARLEHQDWGTLWTELPTEGEDDEALLEYVNQVLCLEGSY